MSYTVKDRYPLFLAGKDVHGDADPIAVEDPATGTTIAHCDAASPEQVSSAIKAAQEAFDSGVWSRRAPADRAAVMSDIARAFSAKVKDLAVLESMQTGRPYREMSTQLGRLHEWFEYAGALARTEEGSTQPVRGSLLNFVKREPLGVCALISSFNHPLLISIKKLAFALAAGNSVILKPSELAPLSVLELGKIVQSAGLPDGVLSILPGLGATTGAALVSDPRIKKVDLTGGTAAGRAIGEVVGRNLASYTAELGGKAPIVVFENVDLDLAVNGVAFASFIASGQTCVAGTRIIIQQSIFDAFVSRLSAKCASIARRIGSPFNKDSMMGPVISARQLGIIETLVESAKSDGARLVCGGERMKGESALDGHDLSSGYFYPPTLITGTDTVPATSLRIWREEAFGPVLVLVPFETEAQAIALANDSEYGLGSALWTRDGAQALRVSSALEHGLCWVNTHHRNDPSSPWGGMKNSGVGRENGHEAYRAYTQSRSVVLNFATEEESKVMDDWFREEDREVRYG
ncbi:aldehyde dehydrogenase domain-containing protein [Rhodotorula diobovata]|uniref:Aldehyde dehydrogenase domain-containing protein n=1 Tax=Rhodotorula diobovata TaxID=5288 RepID=A0A5C5FLV3_9BASI|nr:aldehyde dehydrogenase domain-containing protein [Rhodotorula diobovata]